MTRAPLYHWKATGDIIQAADWNALVCAVEELQKKGEEPSDAVAVAAGVGLALLGRKRGLTRRSFLGLK
jgi:hypothetical protein